MVVPRVDPGATDHPRRHRRDKPVHGVLYSGFLATALVIVAASIDRGHGRLAPRAPDGYTPALAGVVLFLVGGLGDSVWHTLFGIEQDVDALLSPSHLVLGIGAALIVSRPLVSAWSRDRRVPQTDQPALSWPSVVSLGLVVSTAAFFMAFANPLSLPMAVGDRMTQLANFGVERSELAAGEFPLLGQALGIASVIVLAAILTPALLVAVLRWRLPIGVLTLLVLLGVATSAIPHQMRRLRSPPSLPGSPWRDSSSGSDRRWTSPRGRRGSPSLLPRF